ncbi:SAM-dependent methyltransferase, MidA family [Nitrosospira sp. Nsp14]|uniref:class I SAM-dependent methyltransferase n=1 Tax=Nitrosospira sp. Nsp14 TaxID=1855333 RepID=UPI0008F34239|nr:SAM-dependent methyltransferase [Nitrosospira sp. Nsp14]SFH14351.1 SAM-dependent methyltransferase, MidA family [Nitrosospira sp. Nsp14]
MQPLSPQPSLPAPNHAALQHSRAVKELIRAEIAAAGGWISFEHYMRLALYKPGWGYYSGGAAKFGQEGDFVTAPQISSLYGRALARQAAQVLELTDGGNILEFGAGSGKLALDMLLELGELGSLPKRYFILEVSGELRQRQQRLFERLAPHLAPRVAWLEHLPEQFSGLILANEVLDAMPVHLVRWSGPDLFERGVSGDGDEFGWSDRPLMQGELFDAARNLGMMAGPAIGHTGGYLDSSGREDYVSEINLAGRHFMSSLAGILKTGAILLIDYGFGHDEYYHPQRNRGTLMCHYRHYAHDDPFYLPGLQDITSHVDFSAIAEAAGKAGLDMLGYTSQAHFLINCDITSLLAKIPVDNAKEYLPRANQVQKLLSPAEMGELFKAIALGRNISTPLTGFTSGDKSRML